MNTDNVADLFKHFQAMVSDDQSAATLTLAAVIAGREQIQHGESLTAKRAAGFLGVSTDKVYDLAREGRLAHKKIGRAIRFRQADLDAYLQDSTLSTNPVRLKYL